MYKIMDGNEACSSVSYNFTEVAGIYPITPSSAMAEKIDEWSKDGIKNYFNDTVRVVEMESELGAAGMIHGSLQNGCLATTYTASQGLLLMIPNMYKIAGELLPAVINVASRSLSTHALSILGDHQDIYATRMTGFAILAESSVQQVMDLTAIAHLSAIKGRVPFINFFDGFRTSHELQKIEVIDYDKVKALIDEEALNAFRKRAISGTNVTIGTNQSDDIYFQITEGRNTYYENIVEIVNDYMFEIGKITNRDYHPFNYYGSSKAEQIIVAMGSVNETIKETIDYLNSLDYAIGLIEVHLYRPFSEKYFLDVLPKTVKKIAVLDRTKEAGSSGEPLYLDVSNIIKKNNLAIDVFGGRYGLSGKDTSPNDIKAVYDFLNNKPFNNFTVGIVDDVTNLSIPSCNFSFPNNNIEFLVYGFGSDGMISSIKDLMKITGNYTNAFVQGYFQYDSKKSGGVTISHLRFSKEPIRSCYYVYNPSLVVCTKENYVLKYELIDNIKENGVFILNTTKNNEELIEFLPNKVKRIISERNITFYAIDATKICKEVGLDGKLSTVMETIIFKVGNIMNFEFALNKIKESVRNRFSNKSGDIVNQNIEVIDKAINELKKINLPCTSLYEKEVVTSDLFTIIDQRKGNSLPVSAFSDVIDGRFLEGTAKLEKKSTSDVVPIYHKENCIMCNQCSLVCPHGVIRPYLLDNEEKNNADESLLNNCLPANIKGSELDFTISCSIDDCTGCSLCVNTCPGFKGNKALTLENINSIDQDEIRRNDSYLRNEVKEKDVISKRTVKGSQFVTPAFEFPYACAGCGETPYLKLISQLFKEKLVIANATGCSSIYGSSVPSMPYSIPWASSLFEDNAQYGYGMKIADQMMKRRIRNIILENIDEVIENREIYDEYLNNNDYETSEKLYNIILDTPIKELLPLKEYIKTKSFWIVGGDGWAYDIGFGGLDHVLANKENVNILVLDTEVYSNTGGQASKSTRMGAVAKFASDGKKTAKKDLVKIALTYPHVYVATISLGASFNDTIKTLIEAEEYDGPSIIIAYSPCIAHNILKGMKETINQEKQAVLSGYFPIVNYNPLTQELKTSNNFDFSEYYAYIASEDRYRVLKKVNPNEYRDLLENNKNNALFRYERYQKDVDLQENINEENIDE